MSQEKTQNLDQEALSERFLEYLTGSWMAQAIYVAAELRIADLLAAGPRTSTDLAVATNTHAPSLHRLLRALTTIDICRERADGSFEITEMGLLLKTGITGSLRSWALWWGAYLWPVWGSLLYSVRTGKSARTLLTGTESFEHLQRDPEAALVFNEAMAELTRLAGESIVRAYDFSGLKRVTDVGGGYGELLLCILKANPEISGVLFDLPHAIEGAKRRFDEAGLLSRCEFVSGNFLESVPRGSDLYMLKSVIHDWDDEKSKLILEKCRDAMSEGGRLLLVERVLPGRLEISKAHQAIVRGDLTMLVALAAQERSETEFQVLLNSAGFFLTRMIKACVNFSIIEAIPSS